MLSRAPSVGARRRESAGHAQPYERRITRSMSQTSFQGSEVSLDEDTPPLTIRKASDMKKLDVNKMKDPNRPPLFTNYDPSPASSSRNPPVVPGSFPADTSKGKERAAQNPSEIDHTDVPIPSAEGPSTAPSVQDDGSNSLFNRTIRQRPAPLNISRLACYDRGKAHPEITSWNNSFDFENYVTVTDDGYGRVYRFLQDLTADCLRRQSAEGTGQPTKETVLQSQPYLALQQTLSDRNAISEELLADANRRLEKKDRRLLAWKNLHADQVNEFNNLEAEINDLHEQLQATEAQLAAATATPEKSRPSVRVTEPDSSDEEPVPPAHRREGGIRLDSWRSPSVLDHQRRAASALSTGTLAAGYRKQGENPKEKYSGLDPEKYAAWRYLVDQRLEIDAPLFPTETSRVRYALGQLTAPCFEPMTNWVASNRGVSLNEFFEELEETTGASNLKEKAKIELRKVRQRADESISQYYQRLAVLWVRAKYDDEDRIECFTKTIHKHLARAIQTQSFVTPREALKVLRLAEKNNMVIDDYSDRFTSAPAARRNNSTSGSGSSYRTTTTTRTQPREESSAAPSRKPATTKPTDWVGTWYEPLEKPPKLDDAGRAKLRTQGRCFRCHGSGHRIGDTQVCPKANSRARSVNVVKVDSSDDLSSSDNEPSKGRA